VARSAAWFRRRETVLWRGVTLTAAVAPLAALGFMLTVLAVKAWPAVKVNGLAFFTHSTWNPGTGGYGAVSSTHGVLHPATADFGAVALIVGTLESSFIAILIAVPLSIGAAFAVTERLPRQLARALGFGMEVLAGLPSVVIGLWGVFTLGPFLAHHVYPIVADRMPDVPVLRYFANPVGAGEGLLTSSLVLALMITPIIAATTRDLFLQVPPLPKEGGEALGMTEWEVGRRITLPWVRTGIIGATVLGLGRALGETIAIAMICGGATQIAPNIYGTMTTIAATIVTQLDGAGTDATGFYTSTLAELALVLAVISVVVNIAARLIARRGAVHAAPVGAGT
jgi:phosphate transport system permease protein